MRIRTTLFFLILIASFPAAAAAQQQENNRPIAVGLILPLTGAHAQTAEAMKNAAELSYSELPAAVKSQIQLVFEDDQLSGMKAVTAFNKLVTADKISAVVTFGGQSVAAVAPLVQERKIPAFALTADSSLVRGKTFIYQHWLTSGEQARALFQAIDPRHIKRAALVSTTHNAALDIMQKFEEQLKLRRIEVVYKQDFAPSDTDFRTELFRIDALKPDAILGVLVLPHMGIFAKQLREAGMTLPLYCSVNAEAADEVKAAQGAMEGIIYAGPDLSPDFIQHFTARFGRYPEFAAPHVYDAVKLIGRAVAGGAKTPEQINSFLFHLDSFDGAMGNYGIEDGFRFAVRAVPKQIKNGGFVKLSQ